jgi:hypothetical protein
LWDVKDPILRRHQTIGSQMVVMLSVLRTDRALLPRNYFSASGTHFCWRLSKPQGLVRLDGLGKLKEKFIYLIGSGNPRPQPLRLKIAITSLGIEIATFPLIE